MLTNEQAHKLAKDICYYDSKGTACSLNCDECDEPQNWRRFVMAARKVYREIKKMEKENGNN